MNTLARGVLFLCVALIAAAPLAYSEASKEKSPDSQGAGSYQSVRFEANTFEGGTPKQGADKKPMILKGAVVLTLVPEDSSQKPLVMHAAEAIIKPGATADESFESMELNGKVSVDGDMGSVTSEKAVMSMKTRIVRFTGNVVYKIGLGSGKAESLSINMDTQAFEMSASKGEMPFANPDAGDGKGPKKGAASDPSLLKVEDIKDWSGLVGKIQQEGAGKNPAPGVQIMQLLSAKARAQFAQIPAAQIQDKMKPLILGQINDVIRNPKLYDAKAWQGITLDDETNALLRRRPNLEPPETIRLNRLLLEAAYPGMITPAKKAG